MKRHDDQLIRVGLTVRSDAIWEKPAHLFERLERELSLRVRERRASVALRRRRKERDGSVLDVPTGGLEGVGRSGDSSAEQVGFGGQVQGVQHGRVTTVLGVVIRQAHRGNSRSSQRKLIIFCAA